MKIETVSCQCIFTQGSNRIQFLLKYSINAHTLIALPTRVCLKYLPVILVPWNIIFKSFLAEEANGSSMVIPCKTLLMNNLHVLKLLSQYRFNRPPQF